jgi:hypothetical protein
MVNSVLPQHTQQCKTRMYFDFEANDKCLCYFEFSWIQDSYLSLASQLGRKRKVQIMER